MDMPSTHSFRGRNMREAVAKLKEALGGDAVIIGTKRGTDHMGSYVEISAQGEEERRAERAAVARGGRRGVAAAYQAQRTEPKAAPAKVKVPKINKSVLSGISPDARARLLAKLNASPEPTTEPVRRAPRPVATQSAPQPDLGAELAELRAEIAALKAQVKIERSDPVLEDLVGRLVETGLTDAQARELARPIVRRHPQSSAEDGALLADLGRAMADRLECTGSLIPATGRRVLAFVGPTGVGKTTTIAKIAARAKLLEGTDVALVTVDTFRMAAVDQLARYADILDCPLHVVKTPEELPEVLAGLADVPLVLVDTTGRSPRAADQVSALARFFPANWGGEMVLTLANNTREAEAFAAIDAFVPLGCGAVCITKTDESCAPGVVYSVVRRADRPLCYTTCGQRVPEDIECAEGARWAARIVSLAGTGRRMARAS